MSSAFKFIQDNLKDIPEISSEAEAGLILEYLFNLPLKQLRNLNYEAISPEKQSELNKILALRHQRLPIQYILGKAYFFDLELQVTPDVLIPRPETEIMVEQIIAELPHCGVFLDVGSGSGAIAITVGKHRPDTKITAVDISLKALDVAKRNAELNNVANVKFIESNLLENLPNELKFDIIGANLPYVSYSEYEQCQDEVRLFEPQLALCAEDDGLFLIKKCAEAALSHLVENGKICFEIGCTQGERLKKFLSDLSYKEIKIIKDYNQFDRFVMAKFLRG